MSDIGAVFKRCGCRNPETGKRLDRSCPRLGEQDHGTWYFACSAPNVFGRAERVRRGGYPSRSAAVQAQDEWLSQSDEARTGRAWTVARWLRYWLSTRVSIRPTTRLSHAGYIEQFLIPQLGNVRLADLSTRQLAAAFAQIALGRNRFGQLPRRRCTTSGRPCGRRSTPPSGKGSSRTTRPGGSSCRPGPGHGRWCGPPPGSPSGRPPVPGRRWRSGPRPSWRRSSRRCVVIGCSPCGG